MWSHSEWQASSMVKEQNLLSAWKNTPKFFYTVEGNTTFYATPSVSTVNNWKAASHDDFKFT